jgi:hypothetical protein
MYGMWPMISALAGVLVAIAARFYGTAEMAEDELRSVSVAVGTLSGTTLGFVFTALSIFAALFTRDLVQKLKTTGHYSRLVGLMFLSAAIFGVTAVVSVSSLFFSGAIAVNLTSAAVGSCAMALTSLSVAGYQFYLVLTNVR